MVYLWAGIFTLPLTALFTITGVGAAFILIPVFIALGIEIHQAMAVALLLNSLSMISASFRYARKKLILWRIGIPLVITSVIGAPIGARFSYSVNNELLRVCFIAFLLFASGMMFFYRSARHQKGNVTSLSKKATLLSGAAGLAVGFIGGLIGVGGGNIILPILIALGIEPKEAVATTAFVVIFSSLSGFISHMEFGGLDMAFVAVTAGASITGAIIGSWLMTDKLNPNIIKRTLAVILIAVAVKMIISII